MNYIVGLFLIALPLCGLLLLLIGIRGLLTTWRRRPFLESAVGEIIAVETRHPISSHDSPSARAESVYEPVVRFTTASGEVKEFRSAVGKTAPSSPYKIGTSVAVLYDPGEEIPPMLDTWFSIWGGHLACLLGGLVFFGGAAMTYVAFGRRVFNGP
jgi:hypothetical protein